MADEPNSADILMWQFLKVQKAFLAKEYTNQAERLVLDVLHSISCAVSEHQYISQWRRADGKDCNCGYCKAIAEYTATGKEPL